jgi:hypothetical protein
MAMPNGSSNDPDPELDCVLFVIQKPIAEPSSTAHTKRGLSARKHFIHSITGAGEHAQECQ